MEENRNTPFLLKGKDMDSILQSLKEGVSEIFTNERYTNTYRQWQSSIIILLITLC